MSKRILVVDDQEGLRGVLHDLLTGSGYTLEIVGGGGCSHTLFYQFVSGSGGSVILQLTPSVEKASSTAPPIS
jgi:CheY-like chemotaxis protein